VICFQDESGFSLLPVVRATWAPRGQTPVLTHRFSWKRMSMAGVLAYQPDRSQATLVFQTRHGAYNTDSLIEFLTDLAEHLGSQPVTSIRSRPTRRPTTSRPSSASARAPTRQGPPPRGSWTRRTCR
jgi:hypothetical protein